MNYCFEVTSRYRGQPFKEAKYLRPFHEDLLQDSEKTKDIYYFTIEDLINFLFRFPPNSTTNSLSKSKSYQKFTATISLNNETDDKFNLFIHPDIEILQQNSKLNIPAFSIVFVTYNKSIDPSLFQRHTFKKKDVYVCCMDGFYTNETKSDDIPKKHPFRKICKKLKKLGLVESNSSQFFIEEKTISQSWKKALKLKEIETIDKPGFWEGYNGFLQVFTTDNENAKINFLDKKLHSLIFVNSKFSELINESNFIEIDASFDALDPFVYCIPLAIIHNESFPLGVSVGPTENSMLYTQFFELIQKIDNETFKILKEKPFLADEGAAIAKACNDLGFEFLFKCYRHLIEKFGSSSVLGILVRKLLFFKDQELFEKYWNYYKNSIIDILQKSSIHHIKKFEEIFGCSFDPKTETLTEPNFNFQSIWRRMEDGISTCSNHSESCHSVLNRQTKSLKNFHKKFKTLLEFLVNRELNALKRPNLKNALKKFNDFFEKFSSTANIDEMDCSSCQKNSFIQYTKSLFRDFPCFHELSEFKFNEFPHFN